MAWSPTRNSSVLWPYRLLEPRPERQSKPAVINAFPRMRSCPKASVHLALGSLARELIKPPLELWIRSAHLIYHLFRPVKVLPLPLDRPVLGGRRQDIPQIADFVGDLHELGAGRQV